MDTALDKEYSPSLWSRRFSNGDNVVKSHIDVVSQESSRVRSKFKYETFFYGIGANENVDVFGIDLPTGMRILWTLQKT
ncbi:hypothetical protein HA402_008933 [Bradysia odoriphaga]|nr:hypothetical protein HA402_008933 [Bradysia odoriphaga]